VRRSFWPFGRPRGLFAVCACFASRFPGAGWNVHDLRPARADGPAFPRARRNQSRLCRDGQIPAYAAIGHGLLGRPYGLYWPRHVYGRVVEELSAHRALKAVAFDVLFGELRPDHAPVEMADGGTSWNRTIFFALQMRHAGNVVIGFHHRKVTSARFVYATNCARARGAFPPTKIPTVRFAASKSFTFEMASGLQIRRPATGG
jgi:hypothetical protein